MWSCSQIPILRRINGHLFALDQYSLPLIKYDRSDIYMTKGAFMTPSVITLCFLGFAVLMFALEKLPLAVTAMIFTVGFAVKGVLQPKE